MKFGRHVIDSVLALHLWSCNILNGHLELIGSLLKP